MQPPISRDWYVEDNWFETFMGLSELERNKMPRVHPVSWISFDVDYLGGSSDDELYSCVKNCANCLGEMGRPCTQILSMKETEENTNEMIELIHTVDIKKAYMRQCHASIIDLLKPKDKVYNIDAHHDNYSSATIKKDVNCGNWVSWADKHDISVWSPCCPIEVQKYLEEDNGLVYLYICTSPNYASAQTDKHLMEILYYIPCKIDVDLRR